MSQTLKLEYSCTRAELTQAQSLSLRKQLGGGSKWRTWLILLVLLIFAVLALSYVLFHETSSRSRPFYIGAFILIWIFLIWRNRAARNRARPVTTVEVTESDFNVLSPESKFSVPWSGFSQLLESPELFVLIDRPKTMLWAIPKRAFPDEPSQTWFRTQASKCGFTSSAASPPAVAPFPAEVPNASVRFTNRLHFRDFLDRTLSSWQVRLIIIFIELLILGVGLYAAAHPSPHPVNSPLKVFLIAQLPFMLVLVPFIILLISFFAWRSHEQSGTTEEIALSDQVMLFKGKDGSGTLPWTSYTHFKATRKSFILWRKGSQVWTMWPKRQFASTEDLNQTHNLLTKHLKTSTWFFG